MNVYLFTVNLRLALFLAFIFLFIIPFFLLKTKKKFFTIIYLITYLILLSLGVFSDVTITSNSISFSLLITNSWANNKLGIAYLNNFSILINLLLCFPIGVVFPILNSNHSLFKIIFLGLLTTLTIEFLQFLLPIIRFPEILDIINNTISTILGYLYYLLLNKLRGETNDKLSKQKNS